MQIHKKYIWIFPFAGGLIILISFIFPAAYFIETLPTYRSEFFRWMLDFYFSHVNDNGVDSYVFEQSTSLTGIISIIGSSFIIILNLLVVISANKYRKNSLTPRFNWLVIALITVILTISWMIMKEISTLISFDHSFWGLLSPYFGMIGPFIGASLEILGYVLMKKQVGKI